MPLATWLGWTQSPGQVPGFGTLDGDDSRALAPGRAGEQLRSELGLYERALDRCGRFLEIAAKLDFDQRIARISAAQVDLIESAVMGTLGELGLTLEVRDEARRILGRRLTSG